MDDAQALSRRDKFRLALKKFWRDHIVDDDPYDALENERYEALLRAAQAVVREDSTAQDLPLAA